MPMPPKPEMAPKDRYNFLLNERDHLEAKIRKLKRKNKLDIRDPQDIEWYIKVAQLNVDKITEEVETLKETFNSK